MFKKILFFFLTVVFLLTLGAGCALYYFVVVEPGEEIKIENIRSILGKESDVYYSDGVTKLGVFFDHTHRQYVSYEDIPENFINALVAAEDNRFFQHFGFDLWGITRAMIKNVEAGRVVQGGSTLTQQTAKNLFKRADRSIEAKLKELLLALRLEYYYSKEQIFEFYANQFYVSGNGHGLGVAARYYFNKKASELDLVESAFIAGSVKRPNYYNPFIKKSPESILNAKGRANVRLGYVLDKMKEQGSVTQYAYDTALAEGVPFNKGQFGYELDYAMELVRDAVELPVITDALAEQGISNISTSGVKIISSIDKDLQKTTLYSLRRQLSELDVRLRGYPHDEVQKEINSLSYRGDMVLEPGAFLFGTIESITGTGKDLQVAVSFGLKIGDGIIDWQGLDHLALSHVQWRKKRWDKVGKGDKEKLLRELQEGDKIWVSVRALTDDRNVLLDLEKYPQVQGGAVVMQHGIIKSVAGGTENRFFNRAIYGKRPMGSALKPFAFTAAMQLGWNSADPLWNKRDLFVYQNQAYFPRPDHHSPFDQVSMSWAGIKSENVASVWLTYHLTDYLDTEQFKDLATHLGFVRKNVDGEIESYKHYKLRMRDGFGLQVTRDVLRATAYELAVKGVETDFLFEGLTKEYQDIAHLDYGLDYERFAEELQADKEKTEADKKKQGKRLSTRERDEYALRQELLAHNYLRATVLRTDFKTFVSQFRDEFDVFAQLESSVPEYSNSRQIPYLYRSVTDPNSFHFGYNLSQKGEYQPIPVSLIRGILASFSAYERKEFWQQVYLGDMLTVASFDILEKQVDFEYKRLRAKSPYDFEVLSKIRDFRVAVGLQYLVALAKEMGVDSHLEPVLSFPLGSNVITLLEAVRFYEGLASGSVYKFSAGEEGGGAELGVIDRIESGDGTLLYKAAPEAVEVVDPETSLAAGHILENVIKFGTGRQADKNVHLRSSDEARNTELASLNLSVPLLGKTGTANNYTNGSFLGYLPGLSKTTRKMTLDDGYTVGVYVGFDDNKPMRHKGIRIAGAGGALPTWIAIVNKLLLDKGYGDTLDPVDLSFDGLSVTRPFLNQMNLSIDMKNGGVLTQPVQKISESNRSRPSIITFGDMNTQGEVKLKRSYRPFWAVHGI